MSLPERPRLIGVCSVAIALATMLCVATPAPAETPRWQVNVTPVPTHLPPGGEGQIAVLVWNLGGEGEGAPVTVTDNLPAGVTATSIHSETEFAGNGLPETMSCSTTPQPTCTWSKATAPFEEPITPYGFMEINIKVKVEGPPRTATNEARVEGGEAPAASTTSSLNISNASTSFGVERYELGSENANGSLATQAGSHPFAFTTTLGLNTDFEAGIVKPAATLKDVHAALPPGLLGDPLATPRCSDEQFTTPRLETNYCPPESAVGVVLVTVREPAGKLGNPQEPVSKLSPLFNLNPAPGEPARLGFMGAVVPLVLDTSLRAGTDYGVTVHSTQIPQTAEVLATRIIVWGFPGDRRHNAVRGWGCLHPSQVNRLGGCPEPTTSKPFLTLPTACTGPLESNVEADSWPSPSKGSETASATAMLRDQEGHPAALSGCNRVPFNPAFGVQPETQAGATPTGLKADLRVPQETTLDPHGIAESAVKNTTVVLPEGVELSPSAANGLEACPESEPGGVGFLGFDELEPHVAAAAFTGTLPEAWEAGGGFCPNASKVGVVHIRTPLLERELEGGVYLATQNANPFRSLVALYIVAQDKTDGVLVKLAGEVHLDPTTGQVVSTFANTPQVPFEDLRIDFFGGPRGPVTTPRICGGYTTGASFSAWSGGPPIQSPSSFAISSGPDGAPCADPEPFSPSLTAGSKNPSAGAFTPFTTSVSRPDGNQNLDSIQVRLPPGLLGKLASVTPCGEPQASQGTCGPESEIGHTVVSAGLGPDPVTISGGRVFITGPYQGAPYGLSIAAPAKAGPFDLGSGPCDCVVVRAKIQVDPHTSALTITSDPLPTILQGVPLQLKDVDVTVDRPGFTFNPTNCSQFAITAALSGEQGAKAQASVPFEVANCATLPFKPTFTASTQAKSSRLDGASLHVKVTSGAGQANIAKVKVDLPKQLPSRLTTLQKACPASVFEANPAACPAASAVGTATAVTPVLKSPLTGPAYLVSHGGAAFPDLEIVLQGERITLILDGQTDIKKGVTISNFSSVPDAPVSSFDLVLPEGQHSALAAFLPPKAKGSLCGQKLSMPTLITGQNGATIKHTTKIAVAGCPKHPARHANRHKRKPNRKLH
jgi:hypothetical protein